MSSSTVSRRLLLKGLAATAGAVAGSRLTDPWLRDAAAQAAPKKSCVVILHMLGGYNALFSSADSFLNRSFSVNDGNISNLGNGLVVDKATIGSLGDYATKHMATIGVRHGSSDHAQAQVLLWGNGNRNYAIQLAAAMGGNAAIKFAAIGSPPQAPNPSEGSTSLQVISDMGPTIEALVGGSLKSPDRGVAESGLAAAQAMSKAMKTGNPQRSVPLNDGYDSARDALKKVAPPFNYAGLPAVYSSPGTAVNDSWNSKLAAAELMVRAGANVVTIDSPNIWDNHGSRTPNVPVGGTERNLMAFLVIPSLKTFLARMYDPADLGAKMNVTVVIQGDFSRSLPGGDHASSVSPTVIGPRVKVGTTGRTDGNVNLNPNVAAASGLYAYLAALSGVPGTPFGANPHPLVLP